MNNIFKALIAGYGAKKLGGGCFSTILVFVLIWVLLEQCACRPAYTEDSRASKTVSVPAESTDQNLTAVNPLRIPENVGEQPD